MDNEQRRAIARSVAILVAGIIIVGVIIWAIFYRGTDEKKNTGNTSPPTSQQSEKKTADAGNQKTNEPKPATASNQPNTTSQNSRPQQLANVGPGSLWPLFIGAVAGGTTFHVLLRRYRQHLIVRLR